MNIVSNIGITELILILLLALLVVGPERLPEFGRKLGKTLRDVRKAYDNLTRDLGPELTSIQQTTRELRESVDSVRSIPKDVVQSVVKAADMDGTIEELKGVSNTLGQVSHTLSETRRMIKDPLGAAVDTARDALHPVKPAEQSQVESAQTPQVKETAESEQTPQAEEQVEGEQIPQAEEQVEGEQTPQAEATESGSGEKANE